MLFEFEEVTTPNRQAYKPLLLMADDSEAMVNTYISEGQLYEARIGDDIIGVLLCVEVAPNVVELKNIALRPTYRGKGIGKEMVATALEMYAQKGYKKMIIGTANCSIDNIALYQKMGFRLYDVKKDFFASYPKPITEFGIRGVDMWMFERAL